jgi:DnaJ-domain-containing protein 1
MNLVGVVVIALIAFAIGYKLIAWVIDRWRRDESATGASVSSADTAPPPSDSLGAERRHETPEARYARVLGLPRAFTRSEITQRYQTLMAAYHPDKVAGLSPELQHRVAEETRRIREAYEYFRVKYQLT